MKIRTRLTFQYALVTAGVFLLFMFVTYWHSEYARSKAFYRDLEQEAVTKAHLFLSGKVDAQTMQSVYRNNRIFIDEVEVAVYDMHYQVLYHDSHQNDIVKETPQMLERISREGSIQFYIDHYQAIGKVYELNGESYIVTAAAYDSYGYANLNALRNILILLAVIGLSLLAVIGYFLARSALKPVKKIVAEAENISAQNIGRRLPMSEHPDEIGELSRTFNDLLDRLEKAFASQKMFVSNVSHELRTPMAALVTELELAVMKERTPEQYRKAIEAVLQDAHRIIRLIEGLLNLAKTDYEPGQIKKENVRLDELLLDAYEMVMKANPAYKIELVFDSEADDDSVLTVSGNSYLLTTVFVNLMENNCKFSPDRMSRVHISYWEEYAILRFSDNGIGISEEDKAKLFTPFHRGENASYAGGYGIGMALTYKIIQLHSGTIEVFSHEGEGTTFLIRFKHI